MGDASVEDMVHADNQLMEVKACDWLLKPACLNQKINQSPSTAVLKSSVVDFFNCQVRFGVLTPGDNLFDSDNIRMRKLSHGLNLVHHIFQGVFVGIHHPDQSPFVQNLQGV